MTTMNKCTWQSLTIQSIYFWIFLVIVLCSIRDAAVNNPSNVRVIREKWHRAMLKHVDEQLEKNSNFRCPLTGLVMKDPVVAADGYTYEEAAIRRWLSEYDSSPMTNKTMSNNVIPNKFAQTEIENARSKLIESCKHKQFRVRD